ncbi:hypothetical protein HYW42_04045 [Candidatus Daviesbacteria bacterium]|nr:hypothetical protein [Candidatus Daviesbacteria bacterium]
MKRLKIHKLILKNIILTLVVILLINQFFFTNSAKATESSPSADVKSKLEELKKDIASKAAKLKQEITQKLQNKAYIGPVKTKTASSITLTTLNGPKVISISEDTEFESEKKSKTKFSFKTLAGEDYVAALGDADDGGILTAKKIVLLNSSQDSKKHFWGQIISVSGRKLVLKDKEYKSYTVFVDPEAEIFEGKNKVSFETLDTNDFIIFTGGSNEKNVVETEFVYLIPQGGILRPKKLATPSAQISTPSSKKN